MNRVDAEKLKLIKQNSIPLPLSEEYLRKLEQDEQPNAQANGNQAADNKDNLQGLQGEDIQSVTQEEKVKGDFMSHDIQDHRATFTETPLRPREKRRVISSHSVLIQDKLVRSPCSRTSNHNWKPTLPSSPPLIRRSTDLL